MGEEGFSKREREKREKWEEGREEKEGGKKKEVDLKGGKSAIR